MLKPLVVAVVVSSCGRSFAWECDTCCRISTTPNAGTVSYIVRGRALALAVAPGIVKLACLSSNFKLRPRGAFLKSASLPLAAEPIGTPAWPPLEQTCQPAWGCSVLQICISSQTLYSKTRRVPRQLAAMDVWLQQLADC